MKPADFTVSQFYNGRYSQLVQSEASVFGPPPPSTAKRISMFAPRYLEFRWDDNYETRMICGPTAHGHPLGLNEEHLKCAMRKLIDSYAFVGIQERFNESLCLLSKHMGISYHQVGKSLEADV